MEASLLINPNNDLDFEVSSFDIETDHQTLHWATMEGLCTKHLSFSLLAKNLKKRSFEARSDKHSCYILGNFYPVLHPAT